MLSWYLAASSTAGFGCGVFPFTEGIACVSLIMHTTVCSAMGRNACRDCCRIGFRLSAEYAHTAVMFVVNLRKSTDKSKSSGCICGAHSRLARRGSSDCWALRIQRLEGSRSAACWLMYFLSDPRDVDGG